MVDVSLNGDARLRHCFIYIIYTIKKSPTVFFYLNDEYIKIGKTYILKNHSVIFRYFRFYDGFSLCDL